MARSSKSVGGVLRELREEAGLSISALARLAKLDTAALTRIEAEKRVHVRLTTVCQVASALGVSVDEIAVRAGLLKPKKTGAKRTVPVRATALDTLAKVDSLLAQARAGVERGKKQLG